MKTLLRARIESGVYPAGSRFPSARSLVQHRGISYQTAHRIITELVDEGLLFAKQGAGTFVEGYAPSPRGALLVFNPRSRRKDSFGHHLKRLLESALGKAKIETTTAWSLDALNRHKELIPIIWELEPSNEQGYFSTLNGYSIVLNAEPVSGTVSPRIDSIGIDDRSGGANAANLLRQLLGAIPVENLKRRIVVLSAPQNDARSRLRVEGFRSLIPVSDKQVFEADSWEAEAGFKIGAQILAKKPRGIFCCNDRLAEGLIQFAQNAAVELPQIVGFDNAPIAETLNLTTMAIPWEEIVETTVEIAKRRISGYGGPARRQIFAPQAIVRI